MPSSGLDDGPDVARLVRLAGLAGVLGGAAWMVKGTAILVGLSQPPLLLEVAPALFALCLLGVATATMAPGRRRLAVLGLAALSAAVGTVAIVSELVGELVGAALAVSVFALLAGLVTLDRRSRWPAPLAWWLGVATLPAMLLGGALSLLGERLLELPIVALGLAWVVLGQSQLRHRTDLPLEHARA